MLAREAFGEARGCGRVIPAFRYRVTASIAVSEVTAPEPALREADLAVYAAKVAGRGGRAVVYTPGCRAILVEAARPSSFGRSTTGGARPAAHRGRHRRPDRSGEPARSMSTSPPCRPTTRLGVVHRPGLLRCLQPPTR